MVVCGNWVSSVVAKGEDPLGLGRWSYVTLRGKGETKITVVTAYNACQSSGDTRTISNNLGFFPDCIGNRIF